MNDSRHLFEKLAGMPVDGFDLPTAIASQIERLMRILPIEEPDEILAEPPHLLNLGMPSVVDLGYATPARRALYGEHLRAQLQYFEPRVSNPQVSFGGSPVEVEIRANIENGVADGSSLRLRIDQDGLRQL